MRVCARADMRACGNGVSAMPRVSCGAPPRSPALDPPLEWVHVDTLISRILQI